MLDRIGKLEAGQLVTAERQRQTAEQIAELRLAQRETQKALKAEHDICAVAVDEIKVRINRAILWLAIAASGLLFQIFRAKLGL